MLAFMCDDVIAKKLTRPLRDPFLVKAPSINQTQKSEYVDTLWVFFYKKSCRNSSVLYTYNQLLSTFRKWHSLTEVTGVDRLWL